MDPLSFSERQAQRQHLRKSFDTIVDGINSLMQTLQDPDRKPQDNEVKSFAVKQMREFAAKLESLAQQVQGE